MGKILTGFKKLDKLTGGLNNGELIVIASRPAMGKTAFALNILEKLTLIQKIPILIFSLDIKSSSLIQRIMCSQTGIELEKLRLEKNKSNDWNLIAKFIDKVKEAPILIDDSTGVTLSDLRTRARKVKIKCSNLGLIIIDYLQLIYDKTTADRYQAISNISKGLKSLARELKVPVIVLSQLSRKVEERTSKIPALSDLREYGTIEQEANVVMFVHRPEYYDKENPELKNKAQIIVAKQEKGATGEVELFFDSKIAKFKDI